MTPAVTKDSVTKDNEFDQEKPEYFSKRTLAMVFVAASVLCLGGKTYYHHSSTISGNEESYKTLYGEITCGEIARQYDGMSHDAASLCAAMKTNGHDGNGCQHINILCGEKSECTLPQLFLALDMKCPQLGSLVERSERKLSCGELASKFRSGGGQYNNKQLCAAMLANGGAPQCCTKNTIDCCQDASSCKLEDLYSALDMECPAPIVRG